MAIPTRPQNNGTFAVYAPSVQFPVKSWSGSFAINAWATAKAAHVSQLCSPSVRDQVIQSISITPKSHTPLENFYEASDFFIRVFFPGIKREKGKKIERKIRSHPRPLSRSLTHFLLRIQSRTKTRNERIVFRHPHPLQFFLLLLFFSRLGSWRIFASTRPR